MSVRDAQSAIDAGEFAEWLALYRLEGFGEHRDDWRFGMLASVMANLFSKGRFKPEDFMPKIKRRREAPNYAHMLNVMSLFANAQNASAGGR